jgi:uncharacterized repeat protein (TIGR01451 family)
MPAAARIQKKFILVPVNAPLCTKHTSRVLNNPNNKSNFEYTVKPLTLYRMNNPNISQRKIPSAIIILFTLFSTVSFAQLGPHRYIFSSQITYPNWVMAGDVDNDGDVDAFVQNNSPNGIYLFENLGGGQFADGFLIIPFVTGIYFPGTVSKIADLDNDGDGDLISNSNWYRNNGPGLAFISMGSYAPAGFTGTGLLHDMDGDGDLDDIGRNSTGVVMLMNDGSGNFSVGASIGTAGTNTTLFTDLADINGDLIEDLIVGGNNTQTGLYLGLGGGAFGPRDSIDQFLSPARPVFGDVDGDGDLDLMAFEKAPGARWWNNDGSGNFTLADTISTDATLPDVIADIDGDNDVDFSMQTSSWCNTQILQNNNGVSWTAVLMEAVYGYSLQGTRYGAGDLDGDGDLDLMICHGLAIAAWYPNEGGGVIGQRKMFIKTLSGARDVTAADVDLDGDVDFVTASYYGDFVSLFLSNGNATFDEPQLIAEHCDKVSKVRFVDLNADGRPDLITDVAECAVIWNNGNNSWTTDTLPGQLIAKQAMDVDGDLDADLICDGLWLQNDGNGNFNPVIDADIPALGAVDTADINNDGFTDLVSGDGDTITVLLNNGAGDFTAVISPGICNRIDLADMDGDGDVDIASTDVNAAVSVYLNDGNGNFTGSVQYTHASGYANYILTTDIDGDGDADVVWSLSNGYLHEVYINKNLGNGQLAPAELIDPAAEVTVAMMMTDVNNDAVPDLVFARFHSLTWRENFYYNAFRLRGSVFKDFDQDAILDPDDQKVPFQLVRSSANNYLVWTNSSGDYDLGADTGNFNVWTVHPSVYQITNNPDTLTAALTAADPIQSGLNFGMAPLLQDSSAFLSLTSTVNLSRCNASAGVWVHVQNTGTFIPQHVIVDVTIHPDVTVNFYSMNPDSVSGDHYYWHIDSLDWFQQWGIYIEVITGAAGSNSNIHASVSWSGSLPGAFNEDIGGLVICSFDPNDKLVTPQGYGAAGAVDINTDWLTYTVRFQNTGTDTAFTVVIRDTLDADLDWTTLGIVASSHPLTAISVDENGLATFRFNQIYLPDSNVNELASHGFIKYRLAPVNGAADGTTITNTASVYFDLNAPVVTNTVLNTLIDCNLFTPQIAFNGMDSMSVTAGENYQWFQNGDSIAGATTQWLINNAPGIYYAAVTNMYGCVAYSDSLVLVVSGLTENTEAHITVRPNPSRGNFTILGDDVYDAMVLTDLSGRIVRSYTGSRQAWYITEKDALEPGVYLVRLFKKDQEARVTRVIIE